MQKKNYAIELKIILKHLRLHYISFFLFETFLVEDSNSFEFFIFNDFLKRFLRFVSPFIYNTLMEIIQNHCLNLLNFFFWIFKIIYFRSSLKLLVLRTHSFYKFKIQWSSSVLSEPEVLKMQHQSGFFFNISVNNVI